MALNDTAKITILLVLLVFALGMYLSVYVSTNKYCNGLNKSPVLIDRFGDFTTEYKSLTYDKWQNARLVKIMEKTSGLYMTYTYNTGYIRMLPENKLDMNQYWLYAADGTIMQPNKKICVENVARGNPLFVTLCDDSASQQFRLMPDGRVICLNELPYYTTDNKELLKKQKMTCLAVRPGQSGESGWTGGYSRHMVPVPLDCDYTTAVWEIKDVPAAEYVNAIAKDRRPLAAPATPLKDYSTNVTSNNYLTRGPVSNAFSNKTYPDEPAGYPAHYNSQSVRDNISYM